MSHPAGRAGVQRKIQVFLQALAAGGSKPTEQMTPPEARAVLAVGLALDQVLPVRFDCGFVTSHKLLILA